MSFPIPDAVARWIEDGRHDIERFSANGFGVRLHPAQVEVAQALLDPDVEALIYLLAWANRAGKTTLVGMVHMHRLWYKIGLPLAESIHDYRTRWLPSEYRTLHLAPLNELAGAGHKAWGEILKGTSPAQIDRETGKRREAPLGPLFGTVKMRDETGSDHLFLTCVTGGVTDFRSTEGGAGRIEARAWYFIDWDEWSQQENVDDIEGTVLPRIITRASDHDAPILLTGTITPDTEHIAKDWLRKAEDPENVDWWANHASRDVNPSASPRSIARAVRLLSAEDYARTVLGVPGGVKDRAFPDFLVTNAFDPELPRFTPPGPKDGAIRPVEEDEPGVARRRRILNPADSPWTYLHVWDIAIAAAENVGGVFRVPKDWKFGPHRPVIGVAEKVIPGSRSLTDEEIVHTIEETFLPYGGRIVIDTTDAHGKAIARSLRGAGYPVEEFEFNARDGRGVTRKERAIINARALLADQPGNDEQTFDRERPFGGLRMPAAWTKFRDQLAVLRPPPDDAKQKKDAAMVVLMLADVVVRKRHALTRQTGKQRLVVFGRR